MYTPQNLTTFTAAYSGAMSGLVASGRRLQDAVSGDYTGYALIAGSFAQSFDTMWGAVAPDTLEVFMIEKACKGVWENRNSQVNTSSLTNANYDALSNSIIASIQASEAYFSANGITPAGWPGGTDADAVIFTDTTTSIQSNRSVNQSQTGAGINGGTNLGSDTAAGGPRLTADFATILGGDQNIASGIGAVALGGTGNTASGAPSYAEGSNCNATNANDHAEGLATTASGGASHAEGELTTASGNVSHAEGGSTQATGTTSHAEGSSTQANGNNSHAEGSTGTQANGDSSHAEGRATSANGDNSHAEGFSTIAHGNGSHAEGWSSFADRDTQSANASGGGGSPVTAANCVQTSEMVLRGSTPGLAANETVLLKYGQVDADPPDQSFNLVDGKGYTISVEGIARTATGGIAVRSFDMRASARCDAGAVTIAGSEALNTFGDAALNAMTFTVTAGAGRVVNFTFGTGPATTKATRISTRIQFTETD